ncbi:MAG: type I restriction endonuclease [Bacteroidales bacterium]
MDLKDQLKQLSERIERLKDQIHTEEAAKNAFVLPFLQAIGYDIFNPGEVIPEYTADIGLKKGEKVDYAILKDGQPIILIECKHLTEELVVHSSQLLRYFHTSKAKFGILTNGIVYRFYTDLEAQNRMDTIPFLDVNMLDLKENQIEEIKKFHKSYFDIDNIITTANELKHLNALKNQFQSELSNPSESFVRFFTKMVYTGQVTARVLEQFTVLVNKSFNQFINDLITDRLKSALKKETDTAVKPEEKAQFETIEPQTDKVVTTTEEMEAFFIVKSILRTKISFDRVFYRDFQSFFSIILDDSIRKTICRLYLHNPAKKQIGIFDQDKKEKWYDLTSLDDIYNYSEQILQTLDFYQANKKD